YVALEQLSLSCRSAPARIPVDFRIDPDQCVLCMACVRVCPADAVAVQGPEVRIVDEACTRCGVCLPACLHDDIVATGDVARALALAIGGRAAHILRREAALSLDELTTLLERRNVRIDQQEPYFSRLPEERRRHWSPAGGLPLELLREESHASKRFRKVRGLGALEGIARAVAVDRIELGFVDILPCEGCLDHPLLGPRDELFRRREIVGATEPTRSLQPVVDDAVARGGAQRPDRPVVCRVVRGPGQLQAGERPVRPRGGERGAAADGARVRVAYAAHRPGGALRRGRVRDGAGAHGGGGGGGGGG